MDTAQQVESHYSRTALEEKILGALQSAGKDPDQLTNADLGPIDHLHLGGHEATAMIAGLMDLQPGMQLLDVGSGLGGPARFFAEQGCRVTGVDVTEEFIRTAESLTRRLALEQFAEFLQANALALPFEAQTFGGAYMMHVGMNLSDKAGVFREVARVLKPGARFTIFDIMRASDAPLQFPLPWAATPDASYVASPADYRRALEDAGLRVEHERGRRDYALEFMKKMSDRAASPGSALLGLLVLMGEQGKPMLKNVNAAVLSGALEPVEMVATKA